MGDLKTDVLISGGGLAGLSAAAAFEAAGFSVTCVDPNPPADAESDPDADLRTTAILQPGRDFLDSIGVWAPLEAHATPLATMQIADAGGETTDIRLARAFESEDISDRPFGWNLPNWLIRKTLAETIDARPGISFRPGVGTRSVTTRSTEAIIGLTNGERVRARLLVGADGRNSPVREALGIEASVTRYSQKALVFAVTHPIPHDNVSTEIHRSGGPFTLVPLPDRDGRPCSAVVWMERGSEVRRLSAMTDAEFSEAASTRSGHLLGPLTLATRRSAWPIITQSATALTGQRTALVAEAAHVMPPIGAQGLNMSLRDIACLTDLAKQSPEALGTTAQLDAYEKSRRPDIALRLSGIDLLNRTSMIGLRPGRDLRAAGIAALYGIAPLRKVLMRTGLGASA